jgi:DNA-binding response OmpR family regulator
VRRIPQKGKPIVAEDRIEKPTILIVDDEPDAVELVRFKLRGAGYRTLTAGSGSEAVELARDRQPSLIVLDIMMPQLDGFAVCELLRGDPLTSRIPIVLLTAWASEEARVLGLELGADDYITKPFSPRELVLRIERLLHRQSPPPPVVPRLHVRDLTVDLNQRRVLIDTSPVELTEDEYQCFAVLTRKILDRVVSRLPRDASLVPAAGSQETPL